MLPWRGFPNGFNNLSPVVHGWAEIDNTIFATPGPAATDLNEFVGKLEAKQGFIEAMWCGDRQCEDAIKAKTGATARCIPIGQEKVDNTCVCCGQPAEQTVIFARAYWPQHLRNREITNHDTLNVTMAFGGVAV